MKNCFMINIVVVQSKIFFTYENFSTVSHIKVKPKHVIIINIIHKTHTKNMLKKVSK